MLLRVVRAPFVEETALPTPDCLGSLVGNNLIVKRVCFWTLSSVSLSLPTATSRVLPLGSFPKAVLVLLGPLHLPVILGSGCHLPQEAGGSEFDGDPVDPEGRLGEHCRL